MVELLEEDQEEFLLHLRDIHDIEETDFPHVELAREGRPIDWAHVEDLRFSDQFKWPPILVTRTTIGYVLLDGYHRREAMKKKKGTAIKATCKTFGDKREAINAVFEPNVIHGLKASAQTKSDYAYFLHLAYPKMTHKDIAARTNLSRSAVSHAIERKTLKALEQAGQPVGEGEGAPDIIDLPKKEDAAAITEKAREEKGIPKVLPPRTPPDEEIRREEIVKATNALSDDTERLLKYLRDVDKDRRRAAGITATLEAVHKRLEESLYIVDGILRDIMQRQEEQKTETPGGE